MEDLRKVEKEKKDKDNLYKLYNAVCLLSKINKMMNLIQIKNNFNLINSLFNREHSHNFFLTCYLFISITYNFGFNIK